MAHATSIAGAPERVPRMGAGRRTEAGKRPQPYYSERGVTLYRGDCMQLLPRLGLRPGMALTDPPYYRIAPLSGASIDGFAGTLYRAGNGTGGGPHPRDRRTQSPHAAVPHDRPQREGVHTLAHARAGTSGHCVAKGEALAGCFAPLT